MNNEDFEATKIEIADFYKSISQKLNGRDSKTLAAIKREDAYGDLAEYSNYDSEDPELSDVSKEFQDFAESMRDADKAWRE